MEGTKTPQILAKVHKIMDEIAYEISTKKTDPQFEYVSQRGMIENLFAKTRDDYGYASICLRLIVIDSLYSTNANYSYFSFDEMSERILSLGSEEKARNYFRSIAKGGKDSEKLFDEQYGIKKNCSDGSKQISLLSKYAYYCLLTAEKEELGFPIYDSLARDMFNKIARLFGIKDKISQEDGIERYIEKMNKLREVIFTGYKPANSFQQYDILDAYLWRMGKINNGNFSLLLNRENYIRFVKNLKLDKCNLDSVKFDKQVRECIIAQTNPFKGLSEEAYMNSLVKHWKLIINN